MRVLSFIPAFLLAATSFVAAAPTATSSVPVPSCVPSSSGNDAPLQPYIAILTNATSAIQPYNDQLTTLQGSGTPDVNTVSGIIVSITAVISFTVGQLNAVVSVNLSGLDLTSTCSAIYALFILVLSVLNSVIMIATALSGSAIVSLQGVVTNLLNAVLQLVGSLQIFVTASTSGILGPVLTFVKGSLDLMLVIFAAAKVLVSSN